MSTPALVLICTYILLAPQLRHSHTVLHTWLLLIGTAVKGYFTDFKRGINDYNK